MKQISDYTFTNIRVAVKKYNDNLPCVEKIYMRAGKSMQSFYKPGRITPSDLYRIISLYEMVQDTLKKCNEQNLLIEDPEVMLPYIYTSANGFSSWSSGKNMSKSAAHSFFRKCKKLGYILDYRHCGYGKPSRILLNNNVCVYRTVKGKTAKTLVEDLVVENQCFNTYNVLNQKVITNPKEINNKKIIKQSGIGDNSILPELPPGAAVVEMEKKLTETTNGTENVQGKEQVLLKGQNLRQKHDFNKVFKDVVSLYQMIFLVYFKYCKFISLKQRIFAMQQILTLIRTGYSYKMIEDCFNVTAKHFEKNYLEYNLEGMQYKPQLPTTYFNFDNPKGFYAARKQVLMLKKKPMPAAEQNALELRDIQQRFIDEANYILTQSQKPHKHIKEAVQHIAEHDPELAQRYADNVYDQLHLL